MFVLRIYKFWKSLFVLKLYNGFQSWNISTLGNKHNVFNLFTTLKLHLRKKKKQNFIRKEWNIV